MRELVGGKNTIGRTAAVLKKPHKATFTFTFTYDARSKKHQIGCLNVTVRRASDFINGNDAICLSFISFPTERQNK